MKLSELKNTIREMIVSELNEAAFEYETPKGKKIGEFPTDFEAKAFDQSAVLSNHWISKDGINPNSISFDFYQNGVLKQSGDTASMLFTIDQIIAYVSKFITLKTGDVIFTGTPAGVGPIKPGDKLLGRLLGKEMFSIDVA